jgi:hypothetical protein
MKRTRSGSDRKDSPLKAAIEELVIDDDVVSLMLNCAESFTIQRFACSCKYYYQEYYILFSESAGLISDEGRFLKRWRFFISRLSPDSFRFLLAGQLFREVKWTSIDRDRVLDKKEIAIALGYGNRLDLLNILGCSVAKDLLSQPRKRLENPLEYDVTGPFDDVIDSTHYPKFAVLTYAFKVELQVKVTFWEENAMGWHRIRPNVNEPFEKALISDIKSLKLKLNDTQFALSWYQGFCLGYRFELGQLEKDLENPEVCRFLLPIYSHLTNSCASDVFGNLKSSEKIASAWRSFQLENSSQVDKALADILHAFFPSTKNVASTQSQRQQQLAMLNLFWDTLVDGTRATIRQEGSETRTTLPMVAFNRPFLKEWAISRNLLRSDEDLNNPYQLTF